jgi:hypothetical protein
MGAAGGRLAVTWMFARGGNRLFVQRQDTDGVLRLVVWGDDAPERHHLFDDEVRLVRFFSGIEAQLVAAGWSLAHFQPERRAEGPDRRETPRGPDRRQSPSRGPGTLLQFTRRPGRPNRAV